MTDDPDTTRIDAAAAKARIAIVLRRRPLRERTAFWQAVHACYAVVDLGPEAGAISPRPGSARGPANGSGS